MKVTALIPAYNEEDTIGEIVETLHTIKQIKQIVVVNDGSSDQTAKVAEEAKAEVISLSCNQGKGAALQKGIEVINTDIILMLDADLIGLRKEHVLQLLNPLFLNEADMTIGVFNDGRGLTDFAQYVSPNLSGQRAIKSGILNSLGNLENAGFGVEVALNKWVKKHGEIQFVQLTELTHRLKEEKRGIARGIIARFKMYWDIVKVIFISRFKL